MTLEEIINCPICQGTIFTTLQACKDYTSSGELFPVKQCIGCSFVFTSPRPTESGAGHYYKSSHYISHQTAAKSVFDRIYLLVRSFTLRWKYSLIRPYAVGTLLDVGCGTGSFLKYCQQKGIPVVGVEPSDARNSIAGITTYKSLIEAPKDKYAVITLWHVLEHIYSLNETIQQLLTILADNGTIFIAVPNRLSKDAKVYGKEWAAWDVPRHIWHFSEENMKSLLHQNGLRVQETIPMKLDAFYVTLLSEQYLSSGKTTITGVLRAAYNAFASNLSARRTGQYSSLIYRITR